jgi:hypothetical protein
LLVIDGLWFDVDRWSVVLLRVYSTGLVLLAGGGKSKEEGGERGVA